MKRLSLFLALATSLFLGCGGTKGLQPEPKGGVVKGSSEEFLSSLPPEEREEFQLARRGLIASEPGLDIRTRDGKPVWDMKRYEFLGLENPAPTRSLSPCGDMPSAPPFTVCSR